MQRHIIIFIFIFIFSSTNVFSQLSEGGIPLTYDQSVLKTVDYKRSKTLGWINVRKLLKADEADSINNRYSIYENVNIDIKDKGSMLKTEDGSVWTFSINSENAGSLGLIFSVFKLPEGAKLYVYNTETETIYGAFTEKNNKVYETLTIADFPGNQLTIEYFEPDDVPFSGSLVLGKVGQSYREPLKKNATNYNRSYDINCPEGDYAQLEKHSVAKMTYERDDFGYLCTGALINNTRNDGTPYFLTANHCISTQESAQTLVTYFNYEKRECNGVTFLGRTLSGSSLKANYQPSDMALLLLDETPTAVYQPYFAGWNAESDSVIGSGTGIHHPAGEVKKISLDYDQIFSYGFSINWEQMETSAENTHWIVGFDKGFTKGGSSGSPLFDENNRIVGQLHGGGEDYNFYGKLTTSWDEGSFPSKKLKPFLDPDTSNVLIHDGYYPSDNKVDAHFLTDFNDVCIDAEVILYNASLFDPVEWEWNFSPGSVEFINETDKHSNNPNVIFLEDTTYDVSLTVSNGIYTDIQTRKEYIRSGYSVSPEILQENEIRLCSNAFDSINLNSFNSASYSWDIVEGIEYVFIDSLSMNTDRFTFRKNDAATVDSTYNVIVQLVGQHSSCSDTVYKTITLEYPFNDDIENAYPLYIGNNGYFNNRCATTQENEPNPPAGDCNSQNTWCRCEGSDTILENSVWFTIIGPESGVLAIDATGFDNQIALYEAESYEDILSGDENLYRIIAANDDYHNEQKFYAARITNAQVEEGRTYWLQVDGSACGAEGRFRLMVYDESLLVSINQEYDSEIKPFAIYPNPTSLEFVILGEFKQRTSVRLYTVEGRNVWETMIEPQFSNEAQIRLPAMIKSGMYIVEIMNDSKTSINKIIIQ